MSTADAVVLAGSWATPNGDLHVGHLGGPYVAMDVCRRALALEGVPTRTLLGTSWHSTYVDLCAQRTSEAWEPVAARHAAAIAATLTAAEVQWDVMVDWRSDAARSRCSRS
jgi:methionyl-tRNA synthetase